MGVELGKVHVETFPDGEIGVRVLESVRGRDVFVIQSVARRPNFYLMELLILVDAFLRASARSVTAVIPYYGYARQDKRGKEREPITAKLVADLLQTAGVSRILTMDLHAEQIQGFFLIPVDNLYGRPAIVRALEKVGLSRPTVVAPDLGSIKMARAYAEILKGDLAIIDKRRVNGEKVESGALIGDVKGRNALIVDDVISTGNTMQTAARVCRHHGAKQIVGGVTHGLFAQGALERMGDLEKILVTDTIVAEGTLDKLEIVSVAPIFSQAIASIQGAKSMASLQ